MPFAFSRCPREMPPCCRPDHHSEDDEVGGERAVVKGLLDGGSYSGPSRSSHDKAKKSGPGQGRTDLAAHSYPVDLGNATQERRERSARHMDPVAALLLPAAAPQFRAPAFSSALQPPSHCCSPVLRPCFLFGAAGPASSPHLQDSGTHLLHPAVQAPASSPRSQDTAQSLVQCMKEQQVTQGCSTCIHKANL